MVWSGLYYDQAVGDIHYFNINKPGIAVSTYTACCKLAGELA